MNTIGKRIRKIRENAGITQEAMAVQFGITQSNYGRMEKDDSRLDIVRLTKIASILEVQLQDLLPAVTPEPKSMTVIETLVEALKDELKHLRDENVFLRNLVKTE